MRVLIFISFLILLVFNSQAQIISVSLPVNDFDSIISMENVQILDVRTLEEYNTGHLKESMQADWYNQRQFEERIKSLDKTRPVYVYCLTGVRSEAATEMLIKNGFTSVFDLKGGLVAWNQAGKMLEGVTEVNQMSLKEYNTLVNLNGTVLVDFGAQWCPPCRKMEPFVEQLKQESGERYKVVNIDAATQTNLLTHMKVEALPVFIVYKNGKEVWRKQGLTTLEELKAQLN
jgi:rhodanese-related sulfurtransferase